MDYLSKVRRLYAEAIEPYLGQPVGATNEDVIALEQEIGFVLPEAYKQYLLWMGRYYYGCFVGSEWFLQNGYNNGKKRNVLTDLDGLDLRRFTPPEHFFTFFVHQGYIAAWFTLPKEAEDPLVYAFGEGQEITMPELKGAFTEFLLEALEDIAPLTASLYNGLK